MADAPVPWELVRTETFLLALRKYLKKHPDRAATVRRVLTTLTENPHQPSLRLHALTGRLQGLHAVRVTHGDRIVLILAISKHQLVLLDIGTHDAVYR
ncbi:MAG: type II toxin-antitoxin system YafQ family toxin [Verrucomicrobia bacterium]|nr:type II toxin-antitoxin system YafQ family toxin [Verrucomicrobiota bacterium]MDA1088257.1 type II toxin-antitoxin system YafQ family toxin [Verrucomicrobiota bacterium]